MINIFINLLQAVYIPAGNIEEPQQAFLPLIPLIIIGIIIYIIYVVFFRSNEKNINIAILGPENSGKTILWNFFMGRPFSKEKKHSSENVGTFTVPNATCNVKNPKNLNKRIRIFGHDLNGSDDFIRTRWEKLIKESDMIIFVFSSYEYLYSTDYQRDVNQRMLLVKKTIEKYSHSGKKTIYLIGSYADLLENKKKEWTKIIDLIKTKPYCDLANNNDCLNMTSEKDLKEYYNKIFINERKF